jgi:hypothetical protein
MARRGRLHKRIGLSDLLKGGVHPGSQRSPADAAWRKCDRVLRQGLVERNRVTRARVNKVETTGPAAPRWDRASDLIAGWPLVTGQLAMPPHAP